MFSAGFGVVVGLKLLGFAAVGGGVGEGHKYEVHDAGVWVGAVTGVVVVVAPAAAVAAEIGPLLLVAVAGVESVAVSEAGELEHEIQLECLRQR